VFEETVTAPSTNFSLSLDIVDDYVDVGNTSSLSISGDISVSAWINFSNFENRMANVISKINSGNGYDLEKAPFENKLIWVIGDGVDYADVSTDTLLSNTWYHIVCTNDGTTSKIYVNGLYENSTLQGHPNATSSDLRIGIHSSNNDPERFWNGNIDEVAIWNDALTDAEVTALYNSGSGLSASSNSGNYTSSENLQAYWNFNAGTGTTLTDQTANGNNGTINGASWSVTSTTGGDVDYQNDDSELIISWSGSDAASGITTYEYALGTTSGGTEARD
jgi:hypothetical protein